MGVLACAGHASNAGATPPPGSTWKLAWSDDFDGSTIDTTKWIYWLNGRKRRNAVNVASNTFVRDGNLTVRISNAGGKLTAGGLESRMGFGYGYFEVRAKVLGGWAAFWLQSPGVDGVGHPAQYGTEMDIEEACCPGAVQHAVHWNGYGPAHVYETHGIEDAIVADQKGWNVYGLEWTDEAYKFWVNGKLTWTFTTAISERKDEVIRLTQETNGDACGGECLYVVDYVRVYRKVARTTDSDGGAPDAGKRRSAPGKTHAAGEAAGSNDAGAPAQSESADDVTP
jgi:beta-glucanase (GH16 family)